MTDDVIRLLKEFDNPQTVHIACLKTHVQNMHFAVPAQVIAAVKDGLLQIEDNDGPLVDSKRIYSRCLMLTDKGRKELNLPPVVKDAPKAKKIEKTLF
jgi:hypothetical protein